jgi:hypothetical protein
MATKSETDKKKLNNSGPRSIDPAADLPGLDASELDQIEPSERDPLLTAVDGRYKAYLKTFYETANLCVERHDKYVVRHRRWRYVAIIGTGLVACLNFIVARHSGAKFGENALPVCASIGALLLSVLANLETFGNSAERAQAYRDSREMYLDAAQEYDRAWTVAVFALGTSSQAYLNAIELYKRIIAADRELRRTFKDLNKGKQ